MSKLVSNFIPNSILVSQLYIPKAQLDSGSWFSCLVRYLPPLPPFPFAPAVSFFAAAVGRGWAGGEGSSHCPDVCLDLCMTTI